MALKCFDYECEKCRIFFEKFFDSSEPYFKSAPCPNCAGSCQRVFIESPRVDVLAFSAWNDPRLEGYSDKTKYREAIGRRGNFIKEPGTDDDARRNAEAYKKKAEAEFDKKFDKYFQEKYGDKSSEQMKQILAVDKRIHEATLAGDARTIKAMGGSTALPEVDSAFAKPLTGKAKENARTR